MRASLFLLATLLLVGGAGGASAASRTYGLDEDPVRLGRKALDEGRLGEARALLERAVAEEYRIPESKLGLARVAVLEGRWVDAEPLLREAIAARGDRAYPEAQAELGLLLLRFGRDAEARQELERSLEGDGDLWAAHYGLARLELDAERWPQARRRVERGQRARGMREGEDRYHFALARLRLSEGDVDGAEISALRALNLNAAEPEYAALVGRISERKGSPSLAIDAYEKALAVPGTVPTAPMMHTLGRLYAKVERYNEARDRYQRAAAIDSTYAPALRDLADLFRRANRHDQAARTYLRYVLLEREDVDALVALAESCLEIGRPGQALEAAETARALAPDRADVRFAYARAGLRSGDDEARDRAAALFAQLPADAEVSPDDLVSLAKWRMKRGDFDTAREDLGRAIELDPENADAYFQLGMIAMRSGHSAAAIAGFGKSAELRPDSAIDHMNLGIAHYQASHLPEAIAAFRAAVERRSDLNAARLLLAQALAVRGSIDEADAEYARVLEADPDEAKALRGRGFCAIRRASYERAAGFYQAATTADPGNADGWAGLGNARLGMEQWDGARAAYERAAAIDPNNIALKRGRELLEQAAPKSGSE
jgi:tetratricopeptide (TPR) repeat protein